MLRGTKETGLHFRQVYASFWVDLGSSERIIEVSRVVA